MTSRVMLGDVYAVLSELPAAEFDAVLCDPPYGLGFMGHTWDHGVPSAEVWAEMMRVVKPGGHMLAFGGTRTHHRLMVAIEDGGWEIRDCLMWLYGSGFPKSHDIARGIDSRDAPEANTADALTFTHWLRTTGITRADIRAATNSFMDSHYLTVASQPAIPSPEHWEAMRPFVRTEVPAWVDALIGQAGRASENLARREVVGQHGGEMGGFTGVRLGKTGGHITRPFTPEAQRWKGYGTALKPAWEPVILAMRPCRGTYAVNALAHGVAGLNIADAVVEDDHGAGERWPANVLLDEGTAEELDYRTTGASRFYYTAKASRAEREAGTANLARKRRDERSDTAAGSWAGMNAPLGNHHPTVKPVDLARYLASLLLPPRRSTPRRMLVPYSGSGSEMIGARTAGWDEVVGIEREPEYVAIAQERLARWVPDVLTLEMEA